MKRIFEEDTFRETGGTITPEESLILYKIASRMTWEQLTALGLSEAERQTVHRWYDDFTR
jgi:hypothetical protein